MKIKIDDKMTIIEYDEIILRFNTPREESDRVIGICDTDGVDWRVPKNYKKGEWVDLIREPK